MANKLKTMNMPLPEPFIVQLVFKSLPKDFVIFHVNYNAQTEEWNLEKLIAMCVQEEDRLKTPNGGKLVFNVQQKKNFQNNKNYKNKRPSHLAEIRARVAPPRHLSRRIGPTSQWKWINALSAKKEDTTRGIVPSF